MFAGTYRRVTVPLVAHAELLQTPARHTSSTVQHGPAQHSTAQHSTAQHSTAQHSTAQHSTAQHSTAHSTAQHSTAQHSTAQHSTAQHSTAQHSTARHATPRHSTQQRATSGNNTQHHETYIRYSLAGFWLLARRGVRGDPVSSRNSGHDAREKPASVGTTASMPRAGAAANEGTLDTPIAWNNSCIVTATVNCVSESKDVDGIASGQKLIMPITGLSIWSRWHVVAKATVPPTFATVGQLPAVTADTRITRSVFGAPVPPGMVVHDPGIYKRKHTPHNTTHHTAHTTHHTSDVAKRA